MKKINIPVMYCGCGCNHCEYDGCTSEYVECPYCEFGEYLDTLNMNNGETNKFQCSECGKEFFGVICYEKI